MRILIFAGTLVGLLLGAFVTVHATDFDLAQSAPPPESVLAR